MKIFAKAILFTLIFILCRPFCFAGYSSNTEAGFNELRSEHFIIYYRPQVNPGYVSKVRDMSERFYSRIAEEFNLLRENFWLWENRAKIYIARDIKDYSGISSCPGWSGACVNYHTKVIYTYPDQEGFASTFAHELTHIIFREYIGMRQFPLWLDEGMAIYMQDKLGGGLPPVYSSGPKQLISANNYIKFSRLHILGTDSLNLQSPDYVQVFYVESYSIISFLVKKYGRSKFKYFLSCLRDGMDVISAMSKAFSYTIKNMDDLEKQWKSHYSY